MLLGSFSFIFTGKMIDGNTIFGETFRLMCIIKTKQNTVTFSTEAEFVREKLLLIFEKFVNVIKCILVKPFIKQEYLKLSFALMITFFYIRQWSLQKPGFYRLLSTQHGGLPSMWWLKSECQVGYVWTCLLVPQLPHL